MKEKYSIVALVAVGCAIMAVVETVFQLTYAAKSLVKIITFFVLPLVCMKISGGENLKKFFTPNRKGFLKSLAMGLLIYSVIMAVFFATRNIFDYSAITSSLSEDQKVDSRNFFIIAAYISFGNSFLEEFFFRVIAFLQLSERLGEKVAYPFSAVSFAVYHVAMVGGSFPLPLMIVALIGLAAGGYIFNYFDKKNGDIYNSWFIHMFADIALMNVWFIMI